MREASIEVDDVTSLLESGTLLESAIRRLEPVANWSREAEDALESVVEARRILERIVGRLGD